MFSALFLVSKGHKYHQFKYRIYIQNMYTHKICLLQTAHQSHHGTKPMSSSPHRPWDQNHKAVGSRPTSPPSKKKYNKHRPCPLLHLHFSPPENQKCRQKSKRDVPSPNHLPRENISHIFPSTPETERAPPECKCNVSSIFKKNKLSLNNGCLSFSSSRPEKLAGRCNLRSQKASQEVQCLRLCFPTLRYPTL